MVNNPLLERLRQRPHWFQETQFVNGDDALRMQAALGSFHLGIKLTKGFVCVYKCVHAPDFRLGRNRAPGWLRSKSVSLACLAPVPPAPH